MGSFSRSMPVLAAKPATLTAVLAAALAGAALSPLAAAAAAPALPWVTVSPLHGTPDASAGTQISFLGAPAADISQVSVRGTRSGTHAGKLEPYSTGTGASFVPLQRFSQGEQVTVSAVETVHGVHRTIGTSFTVGVLYYPAPAGSTGVTGATGTTGGSGTTGATGATGSTGVASFVSEPPIHPPLISVTTPAANPALGDIFMTPADGGVQAGAMIVNPAGQMVWFSPAPPGFQDADLRVQNYLGQSVLTYWQGRIALGHGIDGVGVIDNPSYRQIAQVKAGNGLSMDLHDFDLEANGTAFITVFEPTYVNLHDYGGLTSGIIEDCVIQEIDVRTGLVMFEWHAYGHVALSNGYSKVPTWKGGIWDWFHINSIDLEADGNVLISARNTWAVYQIQAGTGQILWRLGGLNSSFRMGKGTETAWQHDARVLPDGDITIFDDGSDPPVEPQSRAITISLDLARHTATLVSSVTHPSPLLAASQGNVQTLPNGNLLVDYGGVPEISEYSKGGSLLFDAHLPYDMASYRGYRYPWSARPYYRPAVAASLNNTGEETIVHASWNGATGVASWRVLAGAKRSALRPQSTVAASGFETETLLTKSFIDSQAHTDGYVAVQALDASGHVLGTSQTVAVETFAAALKNAGASR